MALRVLLADESSTIKKVFQLALQDFAVDVTAVSIGLDVIPVTRQFKPDIIFCDVLLQKKNGYEVCAELKADAQLKGVPVILMWSGFMELDQDKLQAARADGHLEKPFDVKDLRSLIQQFVPRTQKQRLSEFLSFPKMPEMIESKAPPAPGVPNASGGMEPTTEDAWNMESFDPIPGVGSEPNDEFQEVPLPPPPKVDALGDVEGSEDPEDGQWSATTLDRFRVNIPEANHDELAVELPNEDLSEVTRDIPTDLSLKVETPEPPPRAPAQPRSAPTSGLNEAQLERIVLEQARGLIESIAWKIVPDLATQIIEREIKRLLSEKGPSTPP